MPYGFDMTNSPEQIERHGDVERPAILLSTSGTRLICGAPMQSMYPACLRNFTAQAQFLVGVHERVAIIGAGARNEFREEDAICCAWIAGVLVEQGFRTGDQFTHEQIERWRGVDLEVIRQGKSARYLYDTGQTADLEYVLEHVDDLKDVYVLRGGEIVTVREAARAA